VTKQTRENLKVWVVIGLCAVTVLYFSGQAIARAIR
jgi:hypothetical protein